MNSSRTTTHQLFELANKFRIPLNDVCSKDQLNLNEPSPGGYIVNMQDSTDGYGTHWVAVWLEIEPKNIRKACYFDSFGIDPPMDIIKFCSRFGAKNIISSTKEIQNINGGHCGQYCIDFLHHMSSYLCDKKKHIIDTENRYYKFINYYKPYNIR